MDEETTAHIEELYKRNHETAADVIALKMFLVCLLEQVTVDKEQLAEALIRHLDALNQKMQEGGVSEPVQRIQRERFDVLAALVLG